MEPHLDSLEVQVCGHPHWLVTSPEYHLKRLLAADFGRIYSLGPCCRNHELGHQHRPEFTMLEWYRPHEPIDALMDDVAAFVALARERADSWSRITVADALERWSTPTDDPEVVVRRLVEDVEPELAKLGCVFLTEYPAALASLARLHPDRPEVSERFEAYVDGVELANGFGELTDPKEQRARFDNEQTARSLEGKTVLPIDERFLAALESGLPDVSGIALGIDRLAMLAVGARDINDVIPFTFEDG